MITLALVINQNQNEVSQSEIKKIKRAVRSEFLKNNEKVRITVYANSYAFNPISTDYKESDCIVFDTKDINNFVSANLVFGKIGDLYSIEL